MTSSSGSDWETDDDAGVPGIQTLPLRPVPEHVSRPGDKLCDVCKRLELSPRRFVVLPGDEEWNKPNKPDELNIHLGPVRDMRGKTDCPLCRLVLVALGGDEVPTQEDGVPTEVVMSWNTNGPYPDPSAPWNHRPEVRLLRPYLRKLGGGFVSKRLNLFPEITLLANDSPTESVTYFIRPVRQDMIDFDLVRNWLALCQTKHGKGCRQNPILKELNRSHPAKEVPDFRCIDVEEDCLVILPAGCRYSALSYVWGPKKFFSTVTSNVKSLEEPGALRKSEYLDQIPPTIKDAIHVAKEIGMRHLWVDNLCIIQDDPEIKGETIKKMDLVYAAADLVIVAAGSETAYSGIAGVHPGSRTSRQPIEEIAPGFRLAFRSRYANSMEGVPYKSRGWTFQETHFALRSLVFIDGTVAFSCQGNDAWEEHVFEPPHELRGQGGGRGGAYEGDDIGTYEWLIQGYSERSLSYETDVYNAWAGVSRELICRLDTDLCHGIPTVYFDWFLLWGPLSYQARRLSTQSGLPVGPSWSWSGWVGCSWPRMWDWYNRSIARIRKAIRRRTWIIWYQRKGHDSTECKRLVRHHDVSDTAGLTFKPNRNFYGRKVPRRFGYLDCSRVEPTELALTDVNPPKYLDDILSNHPGSGFLQFWTVSLTLRLAEPTSPDTHRGPVHRRQRLGIFGRSGRELGTITVQPAWLEDNPVPQEREFILICEGRDERAENGRIDEEDGWRYMAMLIEWRDKNREKSAMGSVSYEGKPSMYAERVAIGSVGKTDLKEALGEGPVWKEIVLG
ncbi:heterokaryon incompatibility protein-domain-containing protein [Achaetomium macrosporum]|uniref:Heterokaryon incompatibility protein-domain-containing protein n=1 Tax=Achaetomium macrosporum TaxID=79813 RepID=A0AAN7H731_9PEZI|nr:heterokaryon incompatibility protein-domain-containing protein [Achaetomium macrosporum]